MAGFPAWVSGTFVDVDTSASGELVSGSAGTSVRSGGVDAKHSLSGANVGSGGTFVDVITSPVSAVHVESGSAGASV